MTKSVVVHGPQGTGKTRHADALRQHFGLTAIHDEWSQHDRLPLRDTLVLTHENPAALGLDEIGVQCIAIDEALRMAGIDQ